MTFKNLVFEGGGVKGIAYVGALGELRKRNILEQIERVAGTSAGSILAVLVGLNYSEDDIREILWGLDFKNFMDDSWGIVRDTKRLIEEYGWYKGDFFRNWIGKLIKEKTGNSESTFEDIKALEDAEGFRDIYIIGANLSTRYAEVFSCEHTPRMCLADAARISMSIPLFFRAVRSVRRDVYVDGAVFNSYPIKLFDREKYVSVNGVETDYYSEENDKIANLNRPISKYVFNKETIGFRLDSKKEIALYRDHAEPQREDIDDFFSYMWGLIESFIDAQDSSHLHSDDWERTIYIDSLGVSSVNFDILDDKKRALVESGKKGVVNYFNWLEREGR